MATVKNFGLAGVAANVQFSKGGGKIDWDGSKFNLTDASGTQVDLLVPLVPTVDADAASKQYVDSVATGLDVKNSVRVATIATIVGTYTAGVSEGQGTWTDIASLVVDGVTLATGDRFLIKDEINTDREGHGIWIYNDAGTAARSTDADNTPNNEVSGGMFTFVEEGTLADTGWVMSSPNGVAILDTASADNLIFSQFSGSASFTGGDGIDITASVISHDTSGTADTTIALADVITFFAGGPSGQLQRASWTNILTDLDILTDAAGGNALTADQGILLTGNNLTLTIPSLTDGAETLVLADSLAVFDGTATLEYTFSDVVDDLNIPHGSDANMGITGFAARIATNDGGDDWVNRTLTTAGAATTNPIVITNPDGIAGDPSFDFAIDGLTAASSPVAANQLVLDQAGTPTSLTITALSTLLTADFDDTRIDAGDGFTAVSTADTVDSVVIEVENFAAGGALRIAEFKHGLVDDACGFIFTNGTNEARIEATGETNCDIRLVPAGTGAVLIGDAGAAVIQGDDGTDLTVKGGDASVPTDAGDLILEGGDGSTTLADGDVLIRPGNGATASTGKVCIQDEDEEDIACFFGTTGTDVNFFQFTSAITGVGPTLTSEGEADVDLTITAKGTGQIVLDGTTWPDAGVALDSILATNTANILTAVTSADDADRVLQHTQGGNIEWVLVSSVGGNSFENWVTDSGTIVADSTSDTASLLGGVGITTAANASTDTITITVALGELTNPGAILTTDEIVWVQGGVGTGDVRLVSEFLADVDIVNALGGNGFAVQTSADNYTARTLDKSVTASEEGIIISDGDGVAGDPQIGLDIQGLTPDSSVVGTDQLVVFNGTNNVKVLVSDLVSGGTLAFRTITPSSGTAPVADSSADELSLLGGATTGIDTTGNSGTDTITFSLDFDTNLTAIGADLAAADLLAIHDDGDGAGVVDSITGQQLADGVQTILSLDNTRITDAANTFVDTDEVAGKVTINTENGTGGSGTQLLATFGAASGSSTITDANFLFQNEDSVDTGGNDELQIAAAGAATDIDIRLAPKGAGEVILGDAAANATLTASDNAAGAGFNLTLSSGDSTGSNGNGGDIIIAAGDGNGSGLGGDVFIEPGNGATDGIVCIRDDDSANVMCFEGVDTAVSSLTTTNSPTGGSQVGGTAPEIKAVSSETNVDIGLLPKGTGTLSVSGTTTYEANVTDDDDIPNRKFVIDTGAIAAGAVQSISATITFSGGAAQTIGTLPADAEVIRARVDVTTAWDTVETVDIGFNGGAADGIQPDTENDPESVAIYDSASNPASTGSVRTVEAAVTVDTGSTTSTGAATVTVEYRRA